jgi:hypothetical protein
MHGRVSPRAPSNSSIQTCSNGRPVVPRAAVDLYLIEFRSLHWFSKLVFIWKTWHCQLCCVPRRSHPDQSNCQRSNRRGPGKIMKPKRRKFWYLFALDDRSEAWIPSQTNRTTFKRQNPIPGKQSSIMGSGKSRWVEMLKINVNFYLVQIRFEFLLPHKASFWVSNDVQS